MGVVVALDSTAARHRRFDRRCSFQGWSQPTWFASAPKPRSKSTSTLRRAGLENGLLTAAHVEAKRVLEGEGGAAAAPPRSRDRCREGDERAGGGVFGFVSFR